MKVLLYLLMSLSVVVSGELIIKDGQSTISINGDVYILKENEKKSFIDGSTICYEEGLGRAIINDKMQLSMKNDSCIQTVVQDKNVFSTLLNSLKNRVLVSFSNTNEKVVDGVSSKDVIFEKGIETIVLNSNQKYLIISSESSGPLPISLSLKDNKDKVLKLLVNYEDINTNFILNINYLNKVDLITVTNGLGTIVKKIKVKKDLRETVFNKLDGIE